MGLAPPPGPHGLGDRVRKGCSVNFPGGCRNCRWGRRGCTVYYPHDPGYFQKERAVEEL